MDQCKAFLINDPETNIMYEVMLDEEDFQRAQNDMHFVSGLLNSAKQTLNDKQSVSASVTDVTPFDQDSSQLQNSSADNFKHSWQHNETIGLINSMQSNYEDLSHPKKRKHVFENISNELLSLGFNVSASHCQMKWKSLVRTYTSNKDNKNKTGRGPSRFQFFEEMDAILGNKPSDQCQHSLESSGLDSKASTSASHPEVLVTDNKTREDSLAQVTQEDSNESSMNSETPSSLKKPRRRNIDTHLIQQRKRDKEKKKRHEERMEIEKEKISQEREKIELFREYLQKKQ